MKNQFIPSITNPFILLIGFMLCCFSADAQLGDQANKYKKRAQRKTERRVDRTVDNAIDDVLDGIFKKKKKNKAPNDDVYMEDSDVYDMEEEDDTVTKDDDITFNDFTGGMTMTYETKISGNTDAEASGKSKYYFDRFQSAYQPIERNGSANVTMIYDLKKKTMTTVQHRANDKTAIVIKRPAVTVSKGTSTENPKVTRLSSTKTIQGYQCHKYLVENDNELMTLWVAEDLRYNFHNLMLSVQNQTKKSSKAARNFSSEVKGFPLEIVVESKTDDEVTTIKISNLEVGFVDPSIFDLSDCEVTDMTSY